MINRICLLTIFFNMNIQSSDSPKKATPYDQAYANIDKLYARFIFRKRARDESEKIVSQEKSSVTPQPPKQL